MRMARDGIISLHLHCGRKGMHLNIEIEGTLSIPRSKVCHAEQKLVKVRINKFNLEKDGGSLLELRI